MRNPDREEGKNPKSFVYPRFLEILTPGRHIMTERERESKDVPVIGAGSHGCTVGACGRQTGCRPVRKPLVQQVVSFYLSSSFSGNRSINTPNSCTSSFSRHTLGPRDARRSIEHFMERECVTSLSPSPSCLRERKNGCAHSMRHLGVGPTWKPG